MPPVIRFTQVRKSEVSPLPLLVPPLVPDPDDPDPESVGGGVKEPLPLDPVPDCVGGGVKEPVGGGVNCSGEPWEPLGG